MKTYIIMAIACMALSTIVPAQETQAPTVVKNAFQQKFPNAREVKWDKEGKGEYEAVFVQDGKKGSANFSETGEWLETEMAIPVSTLPKAVIDGFYKNFTGAGITEVYQISTGKGKSYFEIEYTVKGRKKEVKLNNNGNLFK